MKRTLLAVLTHPDDESFGTGGTLAKYAAEGVDVHICIATGEPVVWFFGTTLGSPVVHLARALWRIPWHRARYYIDCLFDEAHGRYQTYQMHIASDWCAAHIEIEDTGRSVELSDADRLILTHPVDGYFYRLDGRVGGYSIWHDPIP